MRILIAFSLAMPLLSQAPASPPIVNFTPPLTVFPTAGAPISGEILTERVETTASRETVTHRQVTKFYRDRTGRTRTEHDVSEFTNLGPFIQIIDVDAGFTTILMPSGKTALRMKVPPGTTGRSVGIPTLAAGGDQSMRQPGKRTVKTEPLGKRTIEGIEFEASLTTITAEGERAGTGTDEQWTSKELGLGGFRQISGPGLKVTSRIQNVSRTEPDAALFAIPPDYQVQEEAQH